MEILEKIKNLANNFHGEIVAVRRHLHAHPELSLQEHKTAAYLAEQLTAMGIEFKAGVAGTGLVANIYGSSNRERVIALRADMDALPIIQENQVPYKSVFPGVMHACGHDAHMACLLGAAKILNSIKDELPGTIRLLFQPSEETYQGGASQMIAEGALDNPRPVAVFGQHVYPQLQAGKVGVRGGMYMASTDEIYLKVTGKGGHAAMPHLVIDPILIASHILVALQQVVSRRAKPYVPTVLSFGKIIGEGRTNVIPDVVSIDGTFRTFDEEWRKTAHSLIGEIASNVAKSMGGECELTIEHGYPFLINDENLALKFAEWAGDYVGKENVSHLDITMGAEDFAYFSQIAPACFYRLGTGNEQKGITSNIHTTTFDIDEDALKTGMGLMAYLAVKQLEG